MRVFFDTSAFVNRYVREAGTDAVLEWCDQATEIVLSGIALARDRFGILPFAPGRQDY